MGDEDAKGSDCETQAEVDAVLAETGVTMDQVRRWRREGLLPNVVQEQTAFRGSVVLYPRGTCGQIRAAKALFTEKNRASYVGLRLWRSGFPVDEKYWRPGLQRKGRGLDRFLPFLRRLSERFDRDLESETLYEYAAKRLEPVDDVILSRIKGRIDSQKMPTVLRVIGEVGTGEFDNFEVPPAGEEHTTDEAMTVRALDFVNAGSDSILGKRLNLIELLPSELKNVTAAISIGKFERVANAPADEIAKARNDARNGFLIAHYLYEANRWIYGDGALGLRFIAWIARKAPDPVIDVMTLMMFRLRQIPGAILPSDKIAELAKQAQMICLYSKRHEWHWRNDPRFSKILDPKRIKLAFTDQIALKRWRSQLEAIIVQANGRSAIGVEDENREVGKGH